MIRSTDLRLRLRSVYRQHHERVFHWWESGDPTASTTLVLVHGFMAHAMCYRRVAPRLAENYRLVIPDLPGHGRDETFRHPDVEPNVDSLTRWVFHLSELFPGPIHLVGHSLGATLSYELAASERASLESVTLVSPGLRIPRSEVGASALQRLPAPLARFAANRLGLRIYEPLNWHGDPMGRGEARSYLGPLKEVERIDFMLRLGSDLVLHPRPRPQKLTPPTLVIWGERDHIFPVEDANWVAEHVGAQSAVVLPESGHSPMEDRPDQFVDALQAFIDGFDERRVLA